MTEIVATTKRTIWKYFGAMMMEDKGGEQAVSWTRFLGLITFAVWIVLIVLQSLDLFGVKVPWELTAGMGAFAGIKGLKDYGLASNGKASS